MNRNTILNKSLYDDDFFNDLLMSELFNNQQVGIEIELDSELGKDLLSGHDLLDSDEELDESYICLNSFITSQMIPFY